MKTKLLALIVPLMLLFANAQSQPDYKKNFIKRINGISGVLKIDSDVNLLSIQTGEHTYRLCALNYEMETLWKLTIKEEIIASGMFNGNILIVTNPEKPNNGLDRYLGYLINQHTGKVLIHKEIYSTITYNEKVGYPLIATNGAFFKLMVRTRAANEKYVYMGEHDRGYNLSDDFIVFDFDEKLSVKRSFNPQADDGEYIGSAINRRGDVLLATLRDTGRLITVYRYSSDSTQKPLMLCQTANVYNRRGYVAYHSPQLKIYPSALDNDVAYYGFVYENMDKEVALNVTKLNFTTNTSKISNTIINLKYLLALKVKLDTTRATYDNSAKFGHPLMYDLHYLNDESGTLINSISGSYAYGGIHEPVYFNGYSPIITAYDGNMNIKYNKVVPINYANTLRPVNPGYFTRDNTLKVIAYSSEEPFKTKYYELDIITGTLFRENPPYYVRQKQDGLPDGGNILWYNNGFILPYTSQLNNGKYNLSLGQIKY